MIRSNDETGQNGNIVRVTAGDSSLSVCDENDELGSGSERSLQFHFEQKNLSTFFWRNLPDLLELKRPHGSHSSQRSLVLTFDCHSPSGSPFSERTFLKDFLAIKSSTFHLEFKSKRKKLLLLYLYSPFASLSE